MEKKRSNDENKQIYDLCQDIRSFCFSEAGREVINTGGKTKGALHEAQKTSVDESEIGLMIKNHDWKKLFAHEKWLVILETIALTYCLTNPATVDIALVELLRLFPKETEGRVNPVFLKRLRKILD